MYAPMSLAELLGLALVDQQWRLDALCFEHPEVNWFPSRHAGNDGIEAKAICARCPVREPCLDYARSRSGSNVACGAARVAPSGDA
jgi:hypothetical protein